MASTIFNNKWVFFDLPSKPSISGSEVAYWVKNLGKILKVGLEFEYNLPNAKGHCKGTSKTCPCIHMIPENICWKECNNKADCKEAFKDKFLQICNGTKCASFISACLSCEEYKVDCTSCNFLFDVKKDPDGIRNALRREFSPSESYGRINASGVHSVVCDGSLLGKGAEGKGAEVVTIGRRIDYWEFYDMISRIVESSKKKGAYVNERCSIHAHILASYYKVAEGASSSVSELERPLPQIVLANLHQLCRRYQNAITWMSMALDTPENLTRWEKYRVSILGTSPVENTMIDVIRELENISNKPGGKYAWVNYQFSEFNENRDLSRFHIELRPLDGMLAASPVTALSCLSYALVIKAVEISKYGLLEVGPKDWMEQTQSLKKKFLNNISDWNSGDRFSNTMNLTEGDKEILRIESLDLISQVKHILFRLGPAYEVLEKLADKPIAFLRCEGKNWDEIEKYYEVYRPVETIVEQKISKLIDLRQITACRDAEDWVVKVADNLKDLPDVDEDGIRLVIEDYRRNGNCIWSENLGTFLKV